MNGCSNGLVCTTETACQPAQDLLKPEVILNAEQTEILHHPSVPAGKHLTALFYSSDVKHTGNAAKTRIEKQWNLVSRRMTHSGFGPQRCWNWNPQDSSLCSLCPLLKGTKGTKKTFGLIFIQARKFLLNLTLESSGWSHQMYFCLRFPCVCLHVSVHFWPLTIFWWLSAVNVSLLQFELSKNVVTSKWKWTYIFMS